MDEKESENLEEFRTLYSQMKDKQAIILMLLYLSETSCNSKLHSDPAEKAS